MRNLQIKRGSQVAVDTYNETPKAGEPTWTTDTNKLYVGGVEVGGSAADTTTVVATTNDLFVAPYKQGDVRVLSRFVPPDLLAGDGPALQAIDFHDGTYKAIRGKDTSGELADWEFIANQPEVKYITSSTELLAVPYAQGDFRSGISGDSGREGRLYMANFSRTSVDSGFIDDWTLLATKQVISITTIGYTNAGTANGGMLETPYFQGDVRVLDITDDPVLAGTYKATGNKPADLNVGNILDWDMINQSDFGVI